MWVLVLLLGLIGFLQFVIGLTLFYKTRNLIAVALLMALIPIVHHPFALQTNFDIISKELGNLSFVSILAALEIAMGFVISYFNIASIDSHYKKRSYKRFFTALPPVFLLVGIVLTQLKVFNSFSGYDYWTLSLALSGGFFFVVLVLALLIRWLIKDWALRMELKVLLSFFILIGAMLLPIFFQNITIIEINTLGISIPQLSILVSLIVFVGLWGWVDYKYRITKTIWNHFIKFLT